MKYYRFIIIFFFLNISSVLSADYIIQMRGQNIEQQLKYLNSIQVPYEKLAPFSSSEDFKRTFQVNASDNQLNSIKKHLKPVLIEKDIKVEKHAISPGKNPTEDFLSGYQYYSHIGGQKIFRDISDIESEEVLVNNNASIQSLEITKTLKPTDDVLVAIIDTGVDRNHPELKDAIFRNEKECDPEGNVIPRPTDDHDKNGLFGDCQGWDFTAPKKFAHIVSDRIGHGTHISGIIAAKGDDAGILGIAPNVKILPIQVFHQEDKSPFTFISTVTKAILYAVGMNAKIINLSLGWPYTLTPNTFRQALNFALSKGIVVVSSAGNDGNTQFVAPCAIRGVICVGASGIDAKLAAFSNKGLHVDLVAPGEEILSTFPTQSTPSLFPLNGYDLLSGTSQATPMVVGGIALLMNKIPNISPDELYARLSLSSGKKSFISESASGIIKIDQALELKEQALIRPIVKDFQEILTFDGKTFKFSLLFKNYWKEASDIKIDIQAINSQIKFKDNTFNFKDFKQGEIKELRIEGDISSLKVQSELEININIQAQGMEQFNRVHKVEILGIFDNETIIANSQVLDLKPDEVLFFQGPELLTRIRTIPHFLEINTDKSYWLPANEGIRFISLDKDSNKFKANLIQPNEFLKVLSLEQRDFNYDGSDDFLLRYVSNTNPEYIGYHYFSKDGSEIQNFKYYPEASVYAVGTGNYVKHDTQKGPIALPVWIANGKIPEEDLSPNPWIRNEESKFNKNRIYYLSPNGDTLKVRIVDNGGFTDKLKNELGLGTHNHIEFRQISSQSKDDYDNSKLTYLLGFSRTGSDWSTYNIEIPTLGSFALSNSPIKEYQFFGRLASQFDLESNDFLKTNHLVSNQTDQIMITTDASSAKNSVLRSSSFKQKLISNVGHYKSDKLNIQIVESERNLILYKKENNQYIESDKISLNRVSFFGSSTFRSSFLALVHEDNENLFPAIYQDSTFLGNRKISLVLYNPGETNLKASLGNSFKIPNFCTSLNPIQNGNKVMLHILCDINGTLRILKKEF